MGINWGQNYCPNLGKIIHRIKNTGTIQPTGYDGQRTMAGISDLVAIVTRTKFLSQNLIVTMRSALSLKYTSQIFGAMLPTGR